ncbi:MAG: hypothetical protein JXX28_00780 [Deltaproteobacteria bacterium]|nr:hypothetical protein [Deltaproteobacteria bacterium]
MAKQKVSQSQREPVREVREQRSATSLDPSLLEQSARGNQALQAQLGGEQRLGEAGLELVRDVALPQVERTFLALQILPRAPDQVDRFVDILAHSTLDGPLREELIEKLQTDQSAALQVSAAMREVMGTDSEADRSRLIALLDAVWSGLSAGSLGADGWRLPAGDRVPLSGHDEAVGARAEALIAALADHLAPEALRQELQGRGPGEVVVSLGRSVGLALALDEEEEEEEDLILEEG